MGKTFHALLVLILAGWVLLPAQPARAYSGCPDPTNVFSPTLSQYPCTPITATNTGTTAAVAATLAAVAAKTTYLCGFSITATATAATAGNATVVGTVTGNLNFVMGVAATATSGAANTSQTFAPCVPATAANSAIQITSFAAGAGGIAAVSAWGFQQ